MLLFSVLKERIGRREIQIEVDGPSSSRDFRRRLEEELPLLTAYESTLRLAVNEEYADDATVIRPGDEVALITPTSGG